MIATPQRPLDLGRSMDAAFAAYRDAFVPLVVAIAVVAVPVQLLTLLPGRGPVLAEFALETFVVGAITAGLATRALADLRAGVRPTAGSLWRRVGPGAAVLIGTVAMVVVTTVLAAFALVVPAILCWVGFQFSTPVVVIEGRRFASAMGRSRRLVRGSFWRVLGYIVVAGLLSAVASGLLSGAVTSAGAEFGVSVAGFRVLRTLTGIAAQVLVQPVGALLIAVLYFDVRLRREGTDLIAMLDSL